MDAPLGRLDLHFPGRRRLALSKLEAYGLQDLGLDTVFRV
jgi:GTP cyclohydrolase II